MKSLQELKELWKKHDFEIVFGLCIAFILILCLYRKITGQRGTWSKTYYYPGQSKISQYRSKRAPPRESSGEKECRRVLQYLFNKPFTNQRPDFLRNPVTGGNYNLELDCYDSDLRLAVEYNGVQHYRYIPYFHKNKESFLNQKYRDELKRRMCRENGVTLIEVPNTVKVDDIKGFLEKELSKAGYKF